MIELQQLSPSSIDIKTHHDKINQNSEIEKAANSLKEFIECNISNVRENGMKETDHSHNDPNKLLIMNSSPTCLR